MDYLTTHTSLSPIRRGFAPDFVDYKKGALRLVAASDKVYQLLAHCRWFSPGTPDSSTTNTGLHDIAESGVKTKNLSIKYYGRVGPLPKLRKFKNIDLLTTSLVVFEAKDNACPMIECMVFLHQ